jgi:hypothetical protein
MSLNPFFLPHLPALPIAATFSPPCHPPRMFANFVIVPGVVWLLVHWWVPQRLLKDRSAPPTQLPMK